jgi:hypothetical protein
VNLRTGPQKLLVNGEFGLQLRHGSTVKWIKGTMRAEIGVRLKWRQIVSGWVLPQLYGPVAFKPEQAPVDMLPGGWLIVMKASAACAVAA